MYVHAASIEASMREMSTLADPRGGLEASRYALDRYLEELF
jgi:hypothetical protein